MEFKIRVEHKGEVYESNYSERTQEDIDSIEQIVKGAPEGQVIMLSLENGVNKYYFGSKILAESIITIVSKEK